MGKSLLLCIVHISHHLRSKVFSLEALYIIYTFIEVRQPNLSSYYMMKNAIRILINKEFESSLTIKNPKA